MAKYNRLTRNYELPDPWIINTLSRNDLVEKIKFCQGELGALDKVFNQIHGDQFVAAREYRMWLLNQLDFLAYCQFTLPDDPAAAAGAGGGAVEA